MQFLLGSERRVKVTIAVVLSLIVLLFVGIFRLITGSFIVGTLLFLALMYFTLRAVGVFIMYPGSSFYTRSDIEMRMSKEISARMVLFFNSVHFLHICVAKRKYVAYQNQNDLVATILQHNTTMQEVFAMFESSLSKRKLRMLNLYKEIQSAIEEKQDTDALCIKDFIQKPGSIDDLSVQTSQSFRMKFQRIQQIMKEIHSIIKSYSPPEGTFSHMKFRMFEENLYEMRFAFHTWNSGFNYELFMVKTTENDLIETTIIHNTIRKNFRTGHLMDRANTSKKAVLFCNPNGVFIQFFGYDNEYIRNYLRMGYHVILWNYRGYGQSTGNPTICKSQIDSSKVFDFYRQKGYDIQVVHGYSIGGAAAVGLFDKTPEENLSNVDILIIDRSFSSIGEMSIEFGSALHKITKLLFIGDNIDLSKQFESVKCRKLLIWDNIDEVIPDRASIKNRIIKRKRGQTGKSSMYGFDEDLEINQLNEDDIADPDFENLTLKLVFTLRKLIEEKAKLDHKQNNKNVEMEENSTHACSVNATTSDSIDYLIKIINEMDGGGIELLRQHEEMKAMMTRRPDRFHHVCESYVLGLVCYGSYFPLGLFIHDHKKIKEQTLQKLQRSLLKLKSRFNLDASEASLMFQKESSIEQLSKNMYHIYFKLSQLVTDYFSEEWFSLHGSLLPTNNGHNSQLTQQEFVILSDFISVSMAEPMKQEEDEEDFQETEEMF